jgi:hypothetical protein
LRKALWIQFEAKLQSTAHRVNKTKNMEHSENIKTKFRFQDLDIWKEAIDIGNILFDIADSLEKKKLFRFAEQLRGAGMSMSNSIARRSTFENANILILLQKCDLISYDILEQLHDKLDQLCRKITNFQKALFKLIRHSPYSLPYAPCATPFTLLRHALCPLLPAPRTLLTRR